jgi:hypothetical protein
MSSTKEGDGTSPLGQLVGHGLPWLPGTVGAAEVTVERAAHGCVGVPSRLRGAMAATVGRLPSRGLFFFFLRLRQLFLRWLRRCGGCGGGYWCWIGGRLVWCY